MVAYLDVWLFGQTITKLVFMQGMRLGRHSGHGLQEQHPET